MEGSRGRRGVRGDEEGTFWNFFVRIPTKVLDWLFLNWIDLKKVNCPAKTTTVPHKPKTYIHQTETCKSIRLSEWKARSERQ